MWYTNLSEKFRAVAQQNAEGIALKFADEQLSYQQLDSLSEHLLQCFANRGVQQGDVVCLSSDKQAMTYAIIVACWKAGIAYAVFDEQSPVARLQHIFDTCRPKLVLCRQQELCQALAQHELPLLSYDELQQTPLLAPASYAPCPPSQLAYIMFTSGSTGIPNGVAITQGNALEFVNWGQSEYGLHADDVLLGANPLYFDNSVFDTYMSLLTGASLVPMSKQQLGNPKKAIAHINAMAVTTWFSVPSLLTYFLKFKALSRAATPTIKRFIFGGEGFPKNHLQQLFELYSPDVELHNVYGPTECTCICSSYPISARDFSAQQMSLLAPLGQLSKNFFYRILNSNNAAVAEGDIGELVLGGPNVGAGYYNNPDKSREKFIQDPLLASHRQIMYKTGDLVRYDSKDKLLYFCGRADSQVKFMGYRIELGEIEAALSAIAGVDENAVLLGNINKVGVIVAFINSRLALDTIKQRLAEQLPDYMQPKHFQVLPALPKNQNGKIDRNKLREDYFDAN